MHSVAVFGLGRIASGYDSTGSSPVRTHIGAITASPHFSLAAAIDPCDTTRDRVQKQWGLQDETFFYANIAESSVTTVDVAVVATPSHVRLPAVQDALCLAPKVLLIEKPLALSLTEARDIKAQLEQTETATRIVFHRRFDAGHCQIQSRLPQAAPTAVLMRYSKGLFNYGSHLLDLLINWFGPIASTHAISLPTGPATDPNISFQCHMASGFTATIIALDVDYDQFEVDIFYPNARYELRNGGVEKYGYTPQEGLHYPGYVQLAQPTELLPHSHVSGFTELYQNIYGHLSGQNSLRGCTLDEAIMIQEALESVRQSTPDRSIAP